MGSKHSTKTDSGRAPAVLRLTRTDWRITRQSESDAGSDMLLGYIERLERDRYEVLWMTEPPSWAYTESFDTAMVAILDHDHFAGKVEKARSGPAHQDSSTTEFSTLLRGMGHLRHHQRRTRS